MSVELIPNAARSSSASQQSLGGSGEDGGGRAPSLRASVGSDYDTGFGPRKKQKRNKPTLSCEECVERKTKCDRARPACLACVKRQCECRYSEIANIIAAANNGSGRSKSRRQSSKPSVSSSAARPGSPGVSSFFSPYFYVTIGIPMALPQLSFQSFRISPPHPAASYNRSASASSSTSSPFLLSNVPHSRQVNTMFSSAHTHPFANYWTATGGIPEVVGVLPSRDQADALMVKYFESVDPVYPLVHRTRFYAEYNHFWAQPLAERNKADAAMLALHFAMYAMGAQFIEMESEEQRAQIAEFYISAAHQSLRLYPFLSRTSLRSIQAMLLMGYFLMNDNRATDAWAFGGILIRQAYAMGLNRDPDIIAPGASDFEKQQRRKVWQAVYFQDTFLTVLLKLPPTATFSDVRVESLTEDPPDPSALRTPSSPPPLPKPLQSTVINPMSIKSIAPPSPFIDPYIVPPTGPSAAEHDLAFIRSMWRLADLVSESICKPRALSQPLFSSSREKSVLLQRFRALYASLPPALTTSDRTAFAGLVRRDARRARQSLFLRSNYWHCVMLAAADEDAARGVGCHVRGVLEAGVTALEAFFEFWEFLRVDAGVWWVFQHRAFEEALMVANVLAARLPVEPPGPEISGTGSPLTHLGRGELEGRAKAAAAQMLAILDHVGGAAPEMQKTRTEVLRGVFGKIGR
ncbi:hypothetical protein EJ06DRAFT_474234 [Trichodelitschia bisporula]|uniref:Zn(2)-C6 fungal-type domain-containing protein n=1 Tax=Trichodelitschia bisporula TaxID=703511 RepID=A0A6G1I0Z7_9PEZI|nr:hypothetical protein EJ06DRAFT_474234 [Trichodelitschia bisporula]